MKKPLNLFNVQILLQKAIQNQTESDVLLELIKDKPPIQRHERFSVYKNAYRIRLSESLSEDFLRVENKLGTEEFEKLIQKCILSTPSTYKNLAEYSYLFCEFIKKHRIEAYKEAMIDWLEILSNKASNPVRSLSGEQVNEGKLFKVQKHPSTILKIDNDIKIAVYSKNNEVSILETNAETFGLLQFLESERSIEEISHYIEKNVLHDNTITNLIFEWIKEGVLYCKSIQEEE